MSESRIFRGTEIAEAERRDHERSLAVEPRPAPPVLDRDELHAWCVELGAADAGFVEIDRPGLGDEADHARRLFPPTRTLVCLVGVSNPDAIRSVSRATANLAWKHNHAELDRVADQLIRRLNESGVRGVATSIGFPMDTAQPGDLPWQIAHKTVAVEAGMGHMGINRNIIHPTFGNFVLLETVLIDAPVTRADAPLDYNPCLGCNLCVAACPVGAVRTDDDFDFFACMGHNYREFLFGFEDWTSTVAAGDAAAYRSKFNDDETRSMWQSLAFGPNYKAAYCQAVCPAGDDVIRPYLDDRAAWRRDVALPLIRKSESVYVTSGSRAERVAQRNPAKRVRYLDYRPDVSTPGNLRLAARHLFDPAKATGVTVRVHLHLPDGNVTIAVHDGAIDAIDGLDGQPDVRLDVTAPDYIRLLHTTFATAGTQAVQLAASPTDPRFTLDGDPAAWGALLACLD